MVLGGPGIWSLETTNWGSPRPAWPAIQQQRAQDPGVPDVSRPCADGKKFDVFVADLREEQLHDERPQRKEGLGEREGDATREEGLNKKEEWGAAPEP